MWEIITYWMYVAKPAIPKNEYVTYDVFNQFIVSASEMEHVP
jgi:hypothetical protein